ncbi:MAG: putative metal-dependent hydrolase [Candidatus Magasanikbacteria bacterium]|nr:putative metal-dependent hydrolase [Candidatus Magasanikbacteria bacterium]
MTIPILVRVKAPFTRRVIQKIVTAAFRAGGAPQAQCEVSLVGDAEMKRLNFKYRGKNCVTDVLAFGGRKERRKFLAPSAETEKYQGEIVICVPQARRQAKEYGASIKQEMTRLLVHGALHLLSYDHVRVKDAAVMLPLQEKILERGQF